MSRLTAREFAMSHDIEFPSSFEQDLYEKSVDKQFATSVAARAHYLQFSQESGFAVSEITTIQNFVAMLRGLFSDRKILELGPGNHPRFTGDNVYYYDICPPDELLKFYKKTGCQTGNIPDHIHFVSNTADMSIINEKFDLVFSSHNIEHHVCLLSHIKHIERCLASKDYFCCAIPDKRYSFDYFRNISTIFDVLDAYHDGNRQFYHSLKNYCSHVYYMTHNDAKRHWSNDHGSIDNDKKNIQDIINGYLVNKEKIFSIHAWIFTDRSFAELFNALYELDYTSLKLIRLYPTVMNSHSFFAVFQKD